MNNLTTYAKNQIEKFSTEELKNQAASLMSNLEDGADFVMDLIMDVLIERMPEDEFVSFCDTIG